MELKTIEDAETPDQKCGGMTYDIATPTGTDVAIREDVMETIEARQRPTSQSPTKSSHRRQRSG